MVGKYRFRRSGVGDGKIESEGGASGDAPTPPDRPPLSSLDPHLFLGWSIDYVSPKKIRCLVTRDGLLRRDGKGGIPWGQIPEEEKEEILRQVVTRLKAEMGRKSILGPEDPGPSLQSRV